MVNRSLIFGLALAALWGVSAWGTLPCHLRIQFSLPNATSSLLGHEPQRSYLPRTIHSEIDILEPGARIVDVGTGFSLQALRYLKTRPELRVTGIDQFDYYGKLTEMLALDRPPAVVFREPDEEQAILRDVHELQDMRFVYSIGGIAPDVVHNWSVSFDLPLPMGCRAVVGAHLTMFCRESAFLDVEFYFFLSKVLEEVRLRQGTGGLSFVIGSAEDELRKIPANSVAVVTDIFGAFTRVNQLGNPLSYLRQVYRVLRPGGKAFLTMTPASFGRANCYDAQLFRSIPLVQYLDQRSDAINIHEDFWRIVEIVKGENLGFRRAIRHLSPYNFEGTIQFRNYREEQYMRDRSRREGGRRSRDRRQQQQDDWD